MSDTPTQRLPEPGELAEEKKKNRTLMFVLIGVGTLLVAAIIVLLIFLFGANANSGAGTALPTNSASASPTPSDTPSASATPTPSSTPTPTPTPTVTITAAPDNSPKINSFTANPTVVACPAQDAQNPGPTTVSFTWSTSNVDKVEFGWIDHDGNYQTFLNNLPPSGNSATGDFGSGNENWYYPCGDDKTTYVLKATGHGQTKTAKVVVDDRTYN